MMRRATAAAAATAALLAGSASAGRSATADHMAAARARAKGGNARDGDSRGNEESAELRLTWASLEREFGVGPVKKMLTSQRAMLVALDAFRGTYRSDTQQLAAN